jgi:putative addiction module antidote
MKLQLTRMGDATVLVLPEDLLARLGLKAGDTVDVAAENNGVKINGKDEVLAKGLVAADAAMDEFEDVLKALAK